jgi:imidazolonepropionase-like amidohydrolase
MAGPPRALTAELAEAPSWTGDSQSLVYLATDKLKRVGLDGTVADLHPKNLTWGRAVPRGQTVVWAGRLWDGVAATYRENVDVIVDGNVIAAIEPHQEGRKGAALVNASRETVIPGLIESHTHMAAPFGSRFGRLWLSFGITSVREPGTDPYDALERRESWASGARPGPREFFAGGLTDGARVYYGMANSVTTPAHLELEMGRAKALDYDLIKTYVRMPDHFQKTIVAKAHAIGIPVSSHELYPAVGYGVDAVEHLRGTSRRGYSPKQSEPGFSYGDVIDLLAKSGMTITPTIGLQGGFNLLALRDPAILQAPQMLRLYREDERKAFAAAVERARPTMASLERTVAAMQRAIRDIVAKGGHITAGTDSPFIPYGLSFLVELQLYEQAGLTPVQVLRSATSWPAAALGVDKQLGTLEPGKLADMAIVAGDPLARTADLMNVRGVVADGHYYLEDELLRER